MWIAADSHSHLQATGRDQRGREQYRYHAVFADGTAALKFGELIHFGLALGSLRAVHGRGPPLGQAGLASR